MALPAPGGMDFNATSLHAAALGAVFALPLVACSVAGRHPALQQRFPVLEQLHEQQAALQQHFTSGEWAVCSAPGPGEGRGSVAGQPPHHAAAGAVAHTTPLLDARWPQPRCVWRVPWCCLLQT